LDTVVAYLVNTLLLYFFFISVLELANHSFFACVIRRMRKIVTVYRQTFV